MPSKSPLLTLFDIRDNVLFAQQWTAGLTRERFAEDLKTFYAVTRCLEIVSEASRRLPPELRKQHPELPWQQIMGAGNVYRHDYDNVQQDFVWSTVHEKLTELLNVVEAEIKRDEWQPGYLAEPEPDHEPDIEP